MLNEAELYSMVSEDHQKEAQKVLDKYSSFLSSAPGEAVLDLGCGSGDVTTRVILPSLHPYFSYLVGLDISEKMIACARRKCEDPRVCFVVEDAAADLSRLQTALPIGSFHKIFSFLALQWIPDTRQVAVNIEGLLRPGGVCLAALVVRSGVYPVWDAMAASPRWSRYTSGLRTPFNPYQYLADPASRLVALLGEAGLDVVLHHLQDHKDAFSSHIQTDQHKIEKLKSVDPIVSCIPEDLKEEYMREVLSTVKKAVSNRGAVDYTSLTVLCRKPP